MTGPEYHPESRPQTPSQEQRVRQDRNKPEGTSGQARRGGNGGRAGATPGKPATPGRAATPASPAPAPRPPAPRPPAASFRSVGLRYGNGPEILQDVSFTLEPGSFHFLTGPSGAGKTSLLSLLYLAQRPSRGSVELFGQDVTMAPRKSLPALRRRLGVVFQEFRLLDHLSAWDNVALPLRVAGVSESDINRHVGELLTWVGLQNHFHARPPILSGGQKQRVAIARAVINTPDLLVADEPTGNVDDETAVRLMNLFRVMNRQGTTIVIATHNEQLVRQMRQPRLHLEAGRLSIIPPAPAASRAAAPPPDAQPPDTSPPDEGGY